MKIFYTRRFREDLSKPYKKLHLGRYRLRVGDQIWGSWYDENDELKPMVICSDLIDSNNFKSSFCSPSRIETVEGDRYYTAEGLEYNGGLQMFFEIPETDQTMYSYNGSTEPYYQVIIFFYQDITNSPDGPINPAFIVFEKFGKVQDEDGEEIIAFHGLNLSSRKNVIITPPLPDHRCKLVFEESLVTQELEKPWGNMVWENNSLVGPAEEGDGGKISGGKTRDGVGRYISKVSWDSYWLDVVSEEGNTDWVETVYINKFGLKIY